MTETNNQNIPITDPRTMTPPQLEEALGMQAKVDPIAAFFKFGHLPERLQTISRHFAESAYLMCCHCTRSAERTAGLRKLLEAKDCFVRAAL